MQKKNLLIALAVALIVAVLGFGIKHSASATNTEQCVPSEAVAAVWANFSPNDTKGTFIGPALWPTDERGTWNIHDKIPGGHVGPDGVYSKGNPAKGGNWFYRQAGKDAVECPPDEDPTCETDPTLCPPDPTCETDPTLCPPDPTCETDPTLCPPDPTCETDPTLCPPLEPAIKAIKECISQTEVKVTTYEFVDETWVDIGAEFFPAKPSDKCAVSTPDVPEDEPEDEPRTKTTKTVTPSDETVDEVASEVYAYEEGM